MSHPALPVVASGSYVPNPRKMGLRNMRRTVQLGCLALWVVLFLMTRDQVSDAIRVDLFLVTDPLVAALTLGASQVFVPTMLFSLGFVVFTLVFGRAFCGWICPLGTLIDGANRLLKPPVDRFEMSTHNRLQYLKYGILAVMVFGAALGAQWVYLLDPLVLMYRGMTVGIWPVVNSVIGPAAPGETGMAYHGVAFLPVLLFVGAVAITAVTPRFYCRYLCPLGAFYGLLSRVPLVRRRVTGCDACTNKPGAKPGSKGAKECISGCRMGAVDKNPHLTQNHECIRCMSGRSFCHTEAIQFDWAPPGPQEAPDVPVDMGRRTFFALGAGGLGLAPLAAHSAYHRREADAVIRPPRVLDEEVFVDQCIRCAMCVQACPTQTLQLLHMEAGFAGFWTPAITASVGGCKADCNACSVACPTDAIPVFSPEESDKWSVKMGNVTLEKGRCICFTEDKKCAECIDVCPTKAFVVEDAHDGAPRRPDSVDYFRCVGCGLCEEACRNIVYGTPALVTFAHGRGQPTSLYEKPTSDYEEPIVIRDGSVSAR